ncbi:MAG: MFS transporter [Woeseiaceae bacterium]|nr:MFS transporter [Woeseiaceae bacterium]
MNDETDSRAALSSKNFRIYIVGNAISVVGLWIQRLALGWQAWQLSESPLFVGLIAGAQFIPMFLLTPFFGVIVDRISSRNGAIVMHAIMAVISASLASLTLAGSIDTHWLLGLTIVFGIAYSAHSPLRLSLIPDLVKPAQFPNAVAINSIVFNASRFIGPGIAGAIVALYGIGFAYLVNALAYIPVIAALSLIKPLTSPPAPQKHDGYLEQFLEGLRYTRDHPSIGRVVMIAGVSTFFGRGIIEIFPALVVMIFNGGSAQLAAMMAAAGAGAIAASIILSLLMSHRSLPQIVLVGAIGVGVSMFIFALVDEFAGGLGVAALLGFFATMVSLGSQSEMQIKVENELRGRVMSLWPLVIIGGPAIGSIFAGALADDVGSTYTLLLFASLSLGLTVLVAVPRRKGRNTGNANHDDDI